MLVDSPALEFANLFFSLLFAVELTLRYFAFRHSGLAGAGGAYLREWWLDWVATIPWDLLLGLAFAGSGPLVARLLRLLRICRILRFRHAGNSPLFQLLRYRVKRLVEGSLPRQLLVLGVLSALVIGGFTILFNTLQTEFGHGGNLWFSIISMFSSDSLFEVETQTPAIKSLVLILSSVGIVVFNGILIAIIIGSLMGHLEELKKGHGEVREKGHLVLLGRSEFVPHILDEMNTFCRVERISSMKVVVVRDSARQDDDLLMRSRPRVEVIPRIGGAWSTEGLERVSLQNAMGVVVFGGVSHSYDDQRFNDALVTKTLVCINSLMRRHPPDKPGPSVVLHYTEAARARYARGYLERGAARINPVFFDPVFYTAKLIACLCANPHAYTIYNELLTAEGNEFHSVRKDLPANTRFDGLMLRFPKGIPVGFRTDGICRLVPSPDEAVPPGAELVVLGPSSYEASEMEPPAASSRAGVPDEPVAPLPDAASGGVVVVMGVNDKLPRIIEEMRRQGRGGVLVIDNQPPEAFRAWYSERSCDEEPEADLVPEFAECHFRNAGELERVFPRSGVSTVILLADGLLLKATPPDQIDADTFSRLLMTQHMLDELLSEQRREIHLIVEILTKDMEEVVAEFERCSHIVGPLFIGRLLATFTLYPHMEMVFRRLIQTGDVDVVCRPLAEVRRLIPGLAEGKASFADLLRHPPIRCIPLGWVEGPDRRVVLNPSKKAGLPKGAEIVFLQRT
jgi:hypothetical protein